MTAEEKQTAPEPQGQAQNATPVAPTVECTFQYGWAAPRLYYLFSHRARDQQLPAFSIGITAFYSSQQMTPRSMRI